MFDRLERIVDQLRASKGVVLRRATLERAMGPVDAEYEADLAAECEPFVLDDAMRGCWSEVDVVEVEWQSAESDDPAGGVIKLPRLDDLARPAFDEASVEAMAFASDAERSLLLETHHLDLRDATQWTALRTRDGAPMELWYRTEGPDGRSPLDVRLNGDFAGYLELLLRCRGADRWPLLLVDAPSLPSDARRALQAGALPVLRRALTLLQRVPGAEGDAEALLLRCDRLDAQLG